MICLLQLPSIPRPLPIPSSSSSPAPKQLGASLGGTSKRCTRDQRINRAQREKRDPGRMRASPPQEHSGAGQRDLTSQQALTRGRPCSHCHGQRGGSQPLGADALLGTGGKLHIATGRHRAGSSAPRNPRSDPDPVSPWQRAGPRRVRDKGSHSLSCTWCWRANRQEPLQGLLCSSTPWDRRQHATRGAHPHPHTWLQASGVPGGQGVGPGVAGEVPA